MNIPFRICSSLKTGASFLARSVGILSLALSPGSRFFFYSKLFAMFTRYLYLLRVTEKSYELWTTAAPSFHVPSLGFCNIYSSAASSFTFLEQAYFYFIDLEVLPGGGTTYYLLEKWLTDEMAPLCPCSPQ